MLHAAPFKNFLYHSLRMSAITISGRNSHETRLILEHFNSMRVLRLSCPINHGHPPDDLVRNFGHPPQTQVIRIFQDSSDPIFMCRYI